jgi:hypothetical protein
MTAMLSRDPSSLTYKRRTPMCRASAGAAVRGVHPTATSGTAAPSLTGSSSRYLQWVNSRRAASFRRESARAMAA